MVEDKIGALNNVAKKSNRRKKRRTVDISDSSSSSASEVESEAEIKIVNSVLNEDIELTDSDAPLEDEPAEQLEKGNVSEQLNDETRDKLNSIAFTRTEITEQNNFDQKNSKANTIDLKRVNETIEEAKLKFATLADQEKHDVIHGGASSTSELKNSYLELMFENYGEDINSLRKAPDFTNKSLVMLANVLKDGSAMFDVETLKAILESK